MKSDAPILIIDDDESIRSLLDMALESYGYRTQAAFSAEEAIRLLDEGLRPCLAIVDLLMPGMGGKEFLAVVKETSRHRFPAVILSGRTDACEEFQESHLADRCLLKPIALDDLLETVNELTH